MTVRYGNVFQAAHPSKISLSLSKGTNASGFGPNRGAAAVSRYPEIRKSLEQRANSILDHRLAPYALWLLRLTVGAVFLQHVMRPVFGYEPADASQLFGLPAGVSPFAVAWEAIIGLALIYGLWPRVAAIAGAATLTIATILAHGDTASPYGWQMPVLWIAALLAFALAGDGAFALVPSRTGFRTGFRR